MSQACGNLQFVEGGTIKSSSVINSQITDSLLSNSTMQAGSIESLAGIDQSSTKTVADAIAAGSATGTIANAIARDNSSIRNITDAVVDTGAVSSLGDALASDPAQAKKFADAIAALPPEQLTALVNAITTSFQLMPDLPPASGTGQGELPTTVYGDRSALLGKPLMFTKYGSDYVVPVYSVGVCGG